jgi:hypothetical protein
LESRLHNGPQIVLIGLPRPASAASSQQYDQVALVDAERRLAADAGLPYFETDVFWDDSFFSDSSHLNLEGRERYLAEFRAWWVAR